jgi:hypothetical protein
VTRERVSAVVAGMMMFGRMKQEFEAVCDFGVDLEAAALQRGFHGRAPLAPGQNTVSYHVKIYPTRDYALPSLETLERVSLCFVYNYSFSSPEQLVCSLKEIPTIPGFLNVVSAYRK